MIIAIVGLIKWKNNFSNVDDSEVMIIEDVRIMKSKAIDDNDRNRSSENN